MIEIVLEEVGIVVREFGIVLGNTWVTSKR